MATSTIKNTQLRKKVIWTNTNVSEMGDDQVATGFTETPLFVVVKYRTYLNSSGGVYYTSRIYEDSSSNLVTSIRYDGSTNYIVERATSYNFSTNTLGVSQAYRQDTYKTSVNDNKCLIPLQITAYY